MHNYYKIYGLNIKSELKLSYLEELNENERSNIDIEISYGKIPKKFLDAHKINGDIDLDGEEMCMEIGNLARYHIKNGKYITVEAINKNKHERIEAFLLGRAFSILLYQRRSIVIHGSTIFNNEKLGGSIIISGSSGAGKSTLSTKFIESGYKMLADDISVIELEKGEVNVLPAVGVQKICGDIVDYFRCNKDRLVKITGGRDKYYYDRKEEFINKKQKLKSIIILESDDNVSKVELIELNGLEKLRLTMINIFGITYINRMGICPKYLEDIIYLINSINVYKLIRPTKKITVDEQLKKIKEVV
ncbi:hypothetical protein [Clostridium sardiniense]|uniref:hypothetical protein n=1 Tax=Clostridium sardiniense TaxID=29369 RepID=UPI003D32E9BE